MQLSHPQNRFCHFICGQNVVKSLQTGTVAVSCIFHCQKTRCHIGHRPIPAFFNYFVAGFFIMVTGKFHARIVFGARIAVVSRFYGMNKIEHTPWLFIQTFFNIFGNSLAISSIRVFCRKSELSVHRIQISLRIAADIDFISRNCPINNPPPYIFFNAPIPCTVNSYLIQQKVCFTGKVGAVIITHLKQ